MNLRPPGEPPRVCAPGSATPTDACCERPLPASTRESRASGEEPTDPAGSAGRAAAIDREITNRAPWVPLITPRFADLTSARVGNYQASGGAVLLDQLWVR